MSEQVKLKFLNTDVISYIDSKAQAEAAAALASAQGYTDGAVSTEQAAREAEDATMLKLDGSRPMQGDLELGQHSVYGAKYVEAYDDASRPGEYVYMNSGSFVLQKDDPNTSEQIGQVQILVDGISTAQNFAISSTGELSLMGSVIKALAQLSMEGSKIVGLADGVDAGDAATKGQLDSAISGEVTAREAGDAATLASASAYADQKIADLVNSAPATLDTLKEIADALGNDANLAATLMGEIGNLQTQITTETTNRTSADGVLDAKIDQEILDRQAAVLAEKNRAESAEGALDTRVDALEGASVEFVQQKFVLTSTDVSNKYVMLSNLAIGASVNAFVDRLAIHESDDYTLSVVGGVTKVTFVGSLVAPGNESLAAGDVIRVKYAKKPIA